MMGYNNGYAWSGWMLVVMLVWPMLLAFAIWAVFAITRDRAPHRSATATERPIEILDRRFASGEISEREYVDAVALMNNGNSREGHRSTA